MCTKNAHCQKQKLNALYGEVITNNQNLIEFSQSLEKLLADKPEYFAEGALYYRKLPDSVKDTALLIFIYYHRAFDYFNNSPEYDYSYFYDDSGTPKEEPIDSFNKEKLALSGFKLRVISHGDIITAPVPEYIESLVKNYVSKELQDFIACYTEGERLASLFYSENEKTYIYKEGQYLKLLESYIQKNSFAVKHLKSEYINHLISFAFKNNQRNEITGHSGFHIADPSLTEVFSDSTFKEKNSKTARFISIIQSASKKLDNEQITTIYNQLNGSTTNKENSTIVDYDNIEKKLCDLLKEYPCP